MAFILVNLLDQDLRWLLGSWKTGRCSGCTATLHSEQHSSDSDDDDDIYIYIYIYVLFDPVKPELGVIPSGQKKKKKKKFNSEHLNFPVKKLNVTDITEQ